MGEQHKEVAAAEPAEVDGSLSASEAADLRLDLGEPVTVDTESGEAAASEPEGREEGAASLEDLQQTLEETRERLLRSLADFENHKKRSEREQEDLRRFASLEPLREFLLVVDNLQLAAASKGSFEDLKSGLEMILQQMRKLLLRFGVEEIATAGEPFDPSLHEAIARYEDVTVSRQVVAEELQKGYVMHGRLLRPAMVRVAVPREPAPREPAPREPAESDAEEEQEQN